MLLETPDAYVVTADDDVYYGPDWLEALVRRAESRVVCHRAHRVVLAAGDPLPYGDWQRNISVPETGPLVFPTGVGASFMRRACFTRMSPTRRCFRNWPLGR
ncbi:hypothetical protein ACFSS8_08525 [Paracoccus kondratievae]